MPAIKGLILQQTKMADYSTDTSIPTYEPSTETPLFGEERKGVKWLSWLIVAAIAIAIIFSATVGIVFGILHQTPQHIMLTGSMLCLVLVVIVQVRLSS